MNEAEQKAVEGFIEKVCDLYLVSGGTDDVSQLRSYVESVLGESESFARECIGSSEDMQSYIDYAALPIEQRRRESMQVLDQEFSKTVVEQRLYILILGLLYLTLWKGSEGVPLAEIEALLVPCLGRNLWSTVLTELAKSPEESPILDQGTIRATPFALVLSPGGIAGANATLKYVLEEHLKRPDLERSDYQQDLSIALWECAQGKHLDEFGEMLGRQIADQVATLRQMGRRTQARAKYDSQNHSQDN